MNTAYNLRLARQAITLQKNWCAGDLINSQGQMCALGAVARALSIPIGSDPNATISNAYNALRGTEEVRLLAEAAGTLRPEGRHRLRMQRVYTLNDACSHSRVLEMFDLAIAEAEKLSY